MTEHSEDSRLRAARRAVGYWYRMGLALAEAKPPESYAHAYALGRRMAALRRPMQQPALTTIRRFQPMIGRKKVRLRCPLRERPADAPNETAGA